MSIPRAHSCNNILSLSVSHREAPVELRERMSPSPEDLRATLGALGRNGERTGGPSEVAVLSTCHRFEVYALASSERPGDIVDFVSESTGVARDDFLPHAMLRADREAVAHLFRVSSGLESMVLGETQILGQVYSAYELSRDCGLSGPVLSALFRAALHAGKRAQAETSIGRNAGSVSSVAARLAAETIGDLAESRIAVIGAGEMAELAVEALRHRGATRITVVNRSRRNAERLAERWQARALGFERIVEAVRGADIVVSSTGAPHVILTRDLVAEAMDGREDSPLLLIDIAVPRDIDPEVKSLPGVLCRDIDDLEDELSASLAERRRAVPAVESILESETDEFMKYLSALDVVPVLRALKAKAEELRGAETRKALRQLAHLSEEDKAKVDFLTRSILARLLHTPTLRLKAGACEGRSTELASSLRYLFDLDEGEPDES